MNSDTIVVDLVVATDPKDMSLRHDAWSFAIEQRVFGPGRLLLATADRAGSLLAIAHTPNTAPTDLLLACCLNHTFNSGVIPDAAVVFNDEPVQMEPPPADLGTRFSSARETVAKFGVHLVDWFCCDLDSDIFRSTRIALDPGSEWWDLK